MATFSLPPINDNPDGAWGPSSSNLPEQFKFRDIPYAPYSKSDKLGRFADWNESTSDNRQSTVGAPTTQTRGGGPGGRGRDRNQAFGSGTASAFAYFHVEDESSFSLVDNKAAPPRRGAGFSRGRGAPRGGVAYNARGGLQRGRGNFTPRGGNQRGGAGGRRGWRDWEKVGSFNTIQIDAHRRLRTPVLANPLSSSPLSGHYLKKLNSIAFQNSDLKLMSQKICAIPPISLPSCILMCTTRDTYGRLFAYDKTYDRVTTKTERPLQLVDRIKYNTTTSDDPVIQQVNPSMHHTSLN